MAIKKAYETLKSNKNIGDKIKLISNEAIEIEFNEYLHLGCDGDYVDFNFGFTHWHHNGIEHMIKQLTEIANGELVFIENKCWFHPRRLFFILQPWNLKIISKEKFATRKIWKKYMSKKCLRIYTGNEIIKKEGNPIPIKKQENPPEPQFAEDALEIVWNENKTQFCEIYKRHNAYMFRCWKLFYDDEYDIGYQWIPNYSMSISLFDTIEKTKQAARDFMLGK